VIGFSARAIRPWNLFVLSAMKSMPQSAYLYWGVHFDPPVNQVAVAKDVSKMKCHTSKKSESLKHLNFIAIREISARN
jgi:hypothetical protein